MCFPFQNLIQTWTLKKKHPSLENISYIRIITIMSVFMHVILFLSSFLSHNKDDSEIFKLVPATSWSEHPMVS